jgi:hypothetical protein
MLVSRELPGGLLDMVAAPHIIIAEQSDVFRLGKLDDAGEVAVGFEGYCLAYETNRKITEVAAYFLGSGLGTVLAYDHRSNQIKARLVPNRLQGCPQQHGALVGRDQYGSLWLLHTGPIFGARQSESPLDGNG